MKKIVIFVVFICNMLQAEETLFLVNTRHMECIETILYSLSEKSTGSLVFDAFHLIQPTQDSVVKIEEKKHI